MAELATIARPYAEALFKAAGADMDETAAWLDELAAIALNEQLQQFAGDPGVTATQTFDVIGSRAFASLHDFTQWSVGALAPSGVWMAMKGRVPDDELAELPVGVRLFHVEPLVVPGLDAQRCLVWMRPAGVEPN